MEEYDVIIEETAQRDLREIYRHISDTLAEPQIAKQFTQRIREAILNLDRMPERYPLYDVEPWRSLGVRRMNVGNFAVFYIVIGDSNVASVLAVIYGGRDIDKVLGEKLSSENDDDC